MDNQYYCKTNGKLCVAKNKKEVATKFHCKTSDVESLEELLTYLYENVNLCSCKKAVKEVSDRNEFDLHSPTISISPSNYEKISHMFVGETMTVICDNEDKLIFTLSGKVSTPEKVEEILTESTVEPTLKVENRATKQRNKRRSSNNRGRKNSGKNRRTASTADSKAWREQAIKDGIIVPADNYGSDEEHKGWVPSRSTVRSYV